MAAVDLARLQNLVKRDPDSYQDEFLAQVRHFEAQMALLRVNAKSSGHHAKPSTDTGNASNHDEGGQAVNLNSKSRDRQLEKRFGEVVGFVSQTAGCYPRLDVAQNIPESLVELLSETYMSLGQELRVNLVRALILLRRRGRLSPLTLLPLLFRLFGAPDKRLRKLCHQHLVSDIAELNRKNANMRLNRSLQNFLFEMVSDDVESRALHSLGVLTELHRKGVWHDTKTSNVVATAVFSRWPKVSLAAVHFLLRPGRDGDDANTAADAEAAERQRQQLRDAAAASEHSHSRSTKKRRSQARRAIAIVAKLQRAEHNAAQRRASLQLEVLRALHDPQSFAERLFARTRGAGGAKSGVQQSFDTRVLQLTLLCRVIAVHELYLPNLYPYLQRYMQPHQEHAVEILAMFVQCCHPMIGAELLRPCIRTVANNFVHNRSSAASCAVGLNTIREVCARCPHALGQEEGESAAQEAAALVQDLVGYRSHRDKGVVVAARALLRLFREIAPKLLPRASRGRPNAKGDEKLTAAGTSVSVHEGFREPALQRIPGAELLALEKKGGNVGSSNLPVEATRLLSEDDFRKIRLLRVHQMMKHQMNQNSDEEKALDQEESAADEEETSASTDVMEKEEEKPKGKGKSTLADKQDSMTKEMKEDGEKEKEIVESIEDDEFHSDLDDLSDESLMDDEDEDEDEESGVFFNPVSLLGDHKRARRTKEERRATVEAGREGRTPYRSFRANKQRTSTTNAEKRKNQPFILTKQRRDVRDKHKRSRREKQMAELDHRNATRSKNKRRRR